MSDTHILRQPDDFNKRDDDTTNYNMPPFVPEIPSPNAVLIIFADNPRALQFELTESAIIGRRTEDGNQPDVDLAPYGGFPAGVSRNHVRIQRTRLGLLLQDLGSTNGTFVRNQRLTKDLPTNISSGDMVRFGYLQGWIYFNFKQPKTSSDPNP